MNLATFSAILEFAARCEQATAASCEKTLANATGKDRETVDRIKADAVKNNRQLMTILRENVTELVMEPCEALIESAYGAAFEPVATAAALRDQIKRQRDFLRDAAKVVNLREVRRSLEKLAERKNTMLEEG